MDAQDIPELFSNHTIVETGHWLPWDAGQWRHIQNSQSRSVPRDTV
jgi:hypothetical protein